MENLGDDQFQELINQAFDSLPKTHRDRVQNVAILFADEPTAEQREKLRLRHDQTLLGLYEGLPLPTRQGRPTLLPDRITLFKLPLLHRATNLRELQEAIRHTLWHEIAHYYGLNHDQIRDLE
ncbi:MAG TPA: metallopeptidase family protein [Candidatus Saccharimonadales bacterium]|nr:metallopeptidase family protein [Candidatus Saccharimonadales bacterium]